MSQPNKRQKTGPGAGLIDLAGGSESIDLTAESAEPLVINLCDDDPPDTSDDARIARKLQRDLDAAAARAAAVNYGSATRASSGGDIIHAQRRSVDYEAAAGAGRLGRRLVAVDHNAASRPGQPLYERFVQAWRRVPDKTMRLVYHATADENIPNILKNGLDPKRRGSANGQCGGPGEYFGKEISVSAQYARGGSTRLLVFCVLCDPSGITNPGVIHNFLEPGELIVNKIAHQLPLAVVTFDKLPNQGPCSIS